MPYFIARRLKTLAWVYFTLSVLGGLILIFTNLTLLGVGLAIIMQAFIVLFLCQAIAHIIIQNEKILEKLSPKKEESWIAES